MMKHEEQLIQVVLLCIPTRLKPNAHSTTATNSDDDAISSILQETKRSTGRETGKHSS
tara:strand:+ start:697 stop:870 length:174 start_codon:yes stop_codon:yes gene_type:complete